MKHVTTSQLSALRKKWVEIELKAKVQFQALKGDASTRQYYRVSKGNNSYILMLLNTSSELEKCITTSDTLLKNDIPCPKTLACTRQHLMILQEDFGDQRLLESLSKDNVHHWYSQAGLLLKQIQSTSLHTPPLMDNQALIEECNLAWDWYFQHDKKLSADETDFTQPRDWLVSQITQLPYVPTHKDFHAGNLMIHNNTLKIIDYQDLCLGPLGYDLVSLIKDCYIDWPEASRQQWIESHHALIDCRLSLSEYRTAIQLLGLQRHIKCLGIFSRLKHVYQKPNYMQFIPRLLNYIKEAGESLDPLRPWLKLIQEPELCKP
ncbi:MAG TPA: phosphotransferase [Gammaproteobacteria bacterium]|nr:phosphotransferase [Gammaproteobacteria bacterium]